MTAGSSEVGDVMEKPQNASKRPNTEHTRPAGRGMGRVAMAGLHGTSALIEVADLLALAGYIEQRDELTVARPL